MEVTRVLIGLVVFIVGILILVGVHEFGHFIVARWFGIKIQRFSIGFGKPLWRRIGKDGTEFVIAALPLGGYVKMLDERNEVVAPDDLPRTFNQQAVWKRLLVVLAGPAINIILAILLYWLMFAIGFTGVKPIVGSVTAKSIAAAAGLQPQQEIIRVDNHPVANWQDTLMALLQHLGDTDMLQLTTKHFASQKTTQHELDLSSWTINPLFPRPMSSLGIEPFHPPIKPIITKVFRNSPAEKAGLKQHDRITTINGHAVKTWSDVTKQLRLAVGKPVQVSVLRDNKVITFTVIATEARDIYGRDTAQLGVKSPKPTWPQRYLNQQQGGFVSALHMATNETQLVSEFNVVMIYKLITRKISLDMLGGPLSIYEGFHLAAEQSFSKVLNFLGLLSVTLGIINLVPIPGLDGGQVLFLLIETVRRKPMTLRWEMLWTRLGIIAIAMLVFMAVVNDLTRMLVVF